MVSRKGMLISISASMDTPALDEHAVLATRLTIKLGEPLTRCRTVFKKPVDLTMTCSEGLAVLHANVMQRLSEFDAIVWTDSDGIYLKPGTQSKQGDYVKLSPETLSVQVEAAWRNASRRKVTMDNFVVDLYVYAAKMTTGGTQLRRATAQRIRQASEQITRYLESTPAAIQIPQPSSLAFRYFATQYARQPDGATPALPTHAIYRQLQALDASIGTSNAQQVAEDRAHAAPYKTIRVRINGSDVNFDFNMSDLRNALGLPEFDLRIPRPIDTTIANLQGEDMEYIDHMNSF